MRKERCCVMTKCQLAQKTTQSYMCVHLKPSLKVYEQKLTEIKGTRKIRNSTGRIQ